jgi:hypothetical protein
MLQHIRLCPPLGGSPKALEVSSFVGLLLCQVLVHGLLLLFEEGCGSFGADCLGGRSLSEDVGPAIDVRERQHVRLPPTYRDDRPVGVLLSWRKELEPAHPLFSQPFKKWLIRSCVWSRSEMIERLLTQFALEN